jgi:hypothetical protein
MLKVLRYFGNALIRSKENKKKITPSKTMHDSILIAKLSFYKFLNYMQKLSLWKLWNYCSCQFAIHAIVVFYMLKTTPQIESWKGSHLFKHSYHHKLNSNKISVKIVLLLQLCYFFIT